MFASRKSKLKLEGHQYCYLLLGMISILLIVVLLCSPWGPLKSSAIVSLTSSPLFTMDALNGAETEEPKQPFTVLLDVSHGTSETDTVTDGGTQEHFQTAVTSTPTPVSNNVTTGVENNIIVQELTATSIDLKELISFDVFNITNTENVFSTQDSSSKQAGNNVTVIPILETNKAPPYDDQLYPFLEIPMENNTTGKQCFCDIPGPVGQKGDKGERGDPGESGRVGEKGSRGFGGAKGNVGQKGPKGDKGQKGYKGDHGEIGRVGPKGEPGDICPLCVKGEKGNKGINGFRGLKGNKGDLGDKGMKGDMGLEGKPGEKGSKGPEGPKGKTGEMGTKGPMGLQGPVGPKGDRGFPGPLGLSGLPGPEGLPGRNGEKGQKGTCTGHENIAFSVGLGQQRNTLLAGSPIRFEKVFVNENTPYNINSGVFVASIEGIYYFTYQLSLKKTSFTAGLFHNGKVAVQARAGQNEPNIYQASGSMLIHLYEDEEIWLQVLGGKPTSFLLDDVTDSIFLGFLVFPLED